MFKKQIAILPLALMLGISFSGFSQEKEGEEEKDLETEVVEIVKPYTPNVADAFKIKETPVLNDTVSSKKKPVRYSISSIPVASTFSPEKGRAAKMDRVKREKIYDNYATLGFGNYTTLLGELYANFEISKTDNVGFFFQHNSTQGKMKDVILDHKAYDTQLDAHYSSRQKNATYKLDFGAEHQLSNWYGLMKNAEYYFPVESLARLNPEQNYFSVYGGGSVAFNHSFFEKASLNLRYLGDSFSSSEFRATFVPEFAFEIEEVELIIDADVDYLTGSFDRSFATNDGINYGFLSVGVAPSILFSVEDLHVSLGVAGFVEMNLEHDESEFALFPRVDVSYRLDDAALLYAGVDGGSKLNSYYGFKELNPFISPTLYMEPTKTTYDGFAGIKGKVANMVTYGLRASYGNEIHKPLFKSNPVHSIASNEKSYQYGNSFHVVYDEVNTLSIFGELEVEISKIASIGVNVNYFNYSTDEENQAWNLPNIKASLFSNFNITDELYGGASIFFVGERKDVSSLNTFEEVTLDPYVDANVHFGYRINDQFTAFVKGSNLFGDNYTKWQDYPVQGIQGLIGVTYKFDW